MDFSPVPTSQKEKKQDLLERTNGTGYKLLEVGFEDEEIYGQRQQERAQFLQNNFGQIEKSEQIEDGEKMRQSVQIQLDGLRDLHRTELQNLETRHALEL